MQKSLDKFFFRKFWIWLLRLHLKMPKYLVTTQHLPISSAQLLCKIKYYRGHLHECTYVIVYTFENTKKNIW